MNPSPWGTRRLMVPRWRSLAATLASGELSEPVRRSAPHSYRPFSQQLRAKLERWRLVPSAVSAAELVESAIVEGKESEAVSAARFLASQRSNAAPALKELAHVALRRAGYPNEVPAASPIEQNALVHLWRRRTRVYPQNPIAWVELARHQMLRGKTRNSIRSMSVAVQLAPDNRHVLRSAARLYLHADDPERGHDTLVQSRATPHDPWLLSSEIVLAELAERYPQFARQARGSR